MTTMTGVVLTVDEESLGSQGDANTAIVKSPRVHAALKRQLMRAADEMEHGLDDYLWLVNEGVYENDKVNEVNNYA